MKNPIFINGFEKGSDENANIGMGNLVGVDTYSKKGVVKLSKKVTAITGGVFTGYPVNCISTGLGAYIWIQNSDGSVVYSADGGSNWVDTGFPVSGHGNGLIQFQQFVFAFTDTAIYYWQNTVGTAGNNPTAGTWSSSWKSINSLNYTPLTAPHCPFLYPNNRAVYFGNGGTVGYFGQVGTTLFNPAGSAGADYFYNDTILTLPSLTYVVNNINFLPPTNLAISCYEYTDAPQSGDLLTWDTISKDKFSPPLKIYSQAQTNGSSIVGGIKQMFNRNQVLYVTAGGSHTLYETNGSTYNLLQDIGLYSNIRTQGGAESDYPVFFDSYPSAITVFGNRLLTGTAPVNNTTTYPSGQNGFFPVGVWSVTFSKTGENTTQCEYVIPLGDSTVSPILNGNFAKITCISPINIVGSSTSTLLFGFAYKSDSLGTNYGVGLVDLYNYGTDLTYTAIESPLYEIGTALNPQVISNIEINLAKNLLLGQKIAVSYRRGIDSAWTALQTFTGDGTENFYKITQNDIDPTRFIQLRVQMATNAGNPTSTPELRTVKIS